MQELGGRLQEADCRFGSWESLRVGASEKGLEGVRVSEGKVSVKPRLMRKNKVYRKDKLKVFI
ncbi:hypothetical protein DRF69_00005 [Chryseobacterium sp. 5_R23647]|nr:hypothetical protein DRF69_00005 [Chryseobacterium sp. 5_R23647]